MANTEDKGKALRKFALPTLVGAIGTGAGLFLTRKQTPGSSKDGNSRGIGDLADDLRRKLDSVLNGRDESRAKGQSPPRDFIPDEFAERRHEREERRDRRRAKA